MSRKTQKLRRKLERLVAREIALGTSEDEIIGAMEIVKCNIAIAAAVINSARPTKPNRNKNN